MTDRLADRWTSTDFPVLRSIVAASEAPDATDVDCNSISADLGFSTQEVEAAAGNLQRGGYVDIMWLGEGFMVNNITERALRVTGVWPNEEAAGDQLLWILEQKIQAATTPDERGRWARIRDSVVGAGRDFAVELGAAMAARTLGA